ncbi:MAG: adenosylcobinamide-phosphate synthase CbiB [bacterium]|nr:adenosylcobinamide-phosphate synthase CbiB [bacterium]
MIRCRLLAIAIAGLLDFVIGDPHGIWHPIRLVGKLISRLEHTIRNIFPKSKGGERAGGIVLVILVVLMTAGSVLLICLTAYTIHLYVGIAVESILLCYSFAATSLARESMAVGKALEEDLNQGRKAVSMIVGRDTDRLDEAGVISAAVETVAENTSDGVIAPLLFAFLGGAPLAYAYKAINTMDSMVGYRNERYAYFGTAAAKVDDVANFVPARLSAVLLIVASLFGDGKTAGLSHTIKIFRRDRLKHASPNSAQTESVMAGALGLQLAGPTSYFGRLHDKPYIGDALRAIERTDIGRAVRLMRIASVFCWLIGLVVLAVIVRFW